MGNANSTLTKWKDKPHTELFKEWLENEVVKAEDSENKRVTLAKDILTYTCWDDESTFIKIMDDLTPNNRNLYFKNELWNWGDSREEVKEAIDNLIYEWLVAYRQEAYPELVKELEKELREKSNQLKLVQQKLKEWEKLVSREKK